MKIKQTKQTVAKFAKVFAPSEKGWSMVIGESIVYYNSMQEAIAAAETHNATQNTTTRHA